VVVHVNKVVVGALMPAVGTVVFCVMVCDAVAVQPFAPVTVTVYVPGVVTASVAFVPTTVVPFDQEYVPPPVAVKLMDVVVQVRTDVVKAEIAAAGADVFCVMVCDAVPVHPFAAVIVSV
jgi:hypothetical protein